MNDINKKIESSIGHFVKVELELEGYFGRTSKTLEGRIIYSEYQGSLFFLPKGARNRGYKVDESSIGNIEIIRTDKTKHDEYLPLYKNHEIIEQERKERLRKEYETEERERQERNEREKQERKDRINAEIESAKVSGNFEQIKQEVIEYYNSFGEDSYSESFVNNNVIPMLVKIVEKIIPNIDDFYPKHYFDKKRNPKFCHLLEVKTGIKLTNTQKGNVQKINEYLTS